MSGLTDVIADELIRQLELDYKGSVIGLAFSEGSPYRVTVKGAIDLDMLAEVIGKHYEPRIKELLEANNRHEARARWSERFAKMVERNTLAGFTVIGRSMLINMLRDYRKDFPREPMR